MRMIDADAFEVVAYKGIPEGYSDTFGDGVDWILEKIDRQPTIEPERKKGRWIELTNTNHTYVCSVCGRTLVNVTDGKNTVTKNYPFCHCGAEMKGERDE